MLPSQTDYATIVKNLKTFITDEYINSGTPIYKKNKLMGIVNYTGGFSKVFPININNEKIALRFWTKDVEDSKNRYKEIDRYLKVKKLPYFVEFHYVENKLNWQGNQYPFIYMDWVEGRSLLKYIDENIHDKSKIKRLAEKFYMMVQSLHQNDIAHGDLQDENILVIENKNDIILKLIDYDTMYVPKLKGFTLDIVGVEAYQHPKKNNIKTINEKIDYFSELVIYLSLLAYSENSTLWDSDARRQLLFTQKDFLNPNKSDIFKELKKKKYSKEIRLLVNKLIEYCKLDDILKLKPLEDLLLLSFGDKDIDKAYQNFVKISKEKSSHKEISNTILDYLKNNKNKITAKGKVLKYLEFLNSKDDYILPVDYNHLLKSKNFSLIDNIYYLYKKEELEKIAKMVSVNNLVNLAKNATLEDQRNIQKLYYLDSKHIPLDFGDELRKDFFLSLKKVDGFLRKDVLSKTLDRSVLSKQEQQKCVKNIENSNMRHYSNAIDNITKTISEKYIIPTDYPRVVNKRILAVNYVMNNFYTVKEVEKIGEKVAVNNIVKLVNSGTYEDQKKIKKLNELDSKFIPKDFDRMLNTDFYGTVSKIDTFISKQEFDNVCRLLKLEDKAIVRHKACLKNCNSFEYNQCFKAIKDEFLDIGNYSDTVRKYYDKLSINLLDKENYSILSFLKRQFKNLQYINLAYGIASVITFASLFIFKVQPLTMAIMLIAITLLHRYILNYIDRVPNSLMETKNHLLTGSKIFSEKAYAVTSKILRTNSLLTAIVFIYSFITG